MKRLAIAALAAVTFAAPLAPTIASADPPGRYDRDGRRGDRDDRDGRRGDRDGRWDRDDRRDGRRHARWERRQHNGYEYRGRWYYGPPPAAYYRDSSFRPGYHAWRRGDRLPSYYRNQYVVVRDYDRYGLRHPPRGYHYVRDDRGDYLLVGIATGVILSAILSNNY